MKLTWPIQDSVYRAAMGVNQSTLKAFAKCPAEVKWKEEQSKKPRSTDAQILGQLTEARLFGTTYKFAQSKFDNFRTKEAQVWRDEQEAQGVPVITNNMWIKSDCMVRALEKNQDVKRLLRKGRSSVGLFGVDEETGLMKKALVDWACDDDPFLADLKTSCDASPWGFGGQIASYRYDGQDFWYTDLWREVVQEDRTFVFIVVQSSEPWHTAVYSIRPEQRAAAGEQMRLWLHRYKACADADDWPGFTTGVTLIDVPRYVSIPVEPL